MLIKENKLDVAYVIYHFDAVLMVPSIIKDSSDKREASPELLRLATFACTNMPMNKIIDLKTSPLLRKGDIDDLVDNFIVTKALNAFACAGVISKVIFIDD